MCDEWHSMSCHGSVNSQPREISIKTTSLTPSWIQISLQATLCQYWSHFAISDRLLHQGFCIWQQIVTGSLTWQTVYNQELKLNLDSMAFVSVVQLPGTDFLLTYIISHKQNYSRNCSTQYYCKHYFFRWILILRFSYVEKMLLFNLADFPVVLLSNVFLYGDGQFQKFVCIQFRDYTQIAKIWCSRYIRFTVFDRAYCQYYYCVKLLYSTPARFIVRRLMDWLTDWSTVTSLLSRCGTMDVDFHQKQRIIKFFVANGADSADIYHRLSALFKTCLLYTSPSPRD